MPSLYLTLRFLLNLGFIFSSLTLTAQEANACSPCTPCFNCYLAVQRPTLDHYQGSSFTDLMLITVFLHFRSEVPQEAVSKVEFLSPVECLVGFGPGTLRFWLQCLNPLGHSPHPPQGFALSFFRCDIFSLKNATVVAWFILIFARRWICKFHGIIHGNLFVYVLSFS